MFPGLRTQSSWTQKAIEETKAEIKASLANLDESTRMKRCLQQIGELRDQVAADQQMACFIYLMSALVLHERSGGLSEFQIKHLSTLGFKILHLQRIKPESSKLSYLYGELHLILSQIYRKAGRLIESFWQQYLSYLMSKKAPLGEKGLQSFAYGMRMLRLGHARPAIGYFIVAEKEAVPVDLKVRSRLIRVQALRFLRQFGEARALIEQSELEMELGARERLELEWEKALMAAQENFSIDRLLEMVQPEGSHHRGPYVLDVFYLQMCLPPKVRPKQLAKIRYLKTKKELELPANGTYYKLALALEKAQDDEVSVIRHLNNLEKSASSARTLVSVDKAINALGAICRWLEVNKAYPLALMYLREFAALNLKVSEGASRDMFGLMSDLFAQPWANEELRI